ncbi:MAG: T9SS type A sorting domain-containing protein, partial [Dysgonomonas sp.]
VYTLGMRIDKRSNNSITEMKFLKFWILYFNDAYSFRQYLDTNYNISSSNLSRNSMDWFCKDKNIQNINITSSQNINGCRINISNTSITNNATVIITGRESVTLKSGFFAQKGTTVVIKAVNHNSALRTKASNATEENSGISDGNEAIVENLSQNVPNPFSDRTRVDYFVPEESQSAYINIYTLQGNLLKKVPIESKGTGVVYIDAAGLSSGLYFYSLIIDGVKIDTKRMYIK